MPPRLATPCSLTWGRFCGLQFAKTPRTSIFRRMFEFCLSTAADGIFLSDFEQGEIGPDLFVAACQMGLEGLVSKRRDQPYRGGRSKHWIKVKSRKHPAIQRVMDSF